MGAVLGDCLCTVNVFLQQYYQSYCLSWYACTYLLPFYVHQQDDDVAGNVETYKEDWEICISKTYVSTGTLEMHSLHDVGCWRNGCHQTENCKYLKYFNLFAYYVYNAEGVTWHSKNVFLFLEHLLIPCSGKKRLNVHIRTLFSINYSFFLTIAIVLKNLVHIKTKRRNCSCSIQVHETVQTKNLSQFRRILLHPATKKRARFLHILSRTYQAN